MPRGDDVLQHCTLTGRLQLDALVEAEGQSEDAQRRLGQRGGILGDLDVPCDTLGCRSVPDGRHLAGCSRSTAIWRSTRESAWMGEKEMQRMRGLVLMALSPLRQRASLRPASCTCRRNCGRAASSLAERTLAEDSPVIQITDLVVVLDRGNAMGDGDDGQPRRVEL